MRQLAPLFGVFDSATDRIIDRLGPMLALQSRKREYRCSTNHQVGIDADATRTP